MNDTTPGRPVPRTRPRPAPDSGADPADVSPSSAPQPVESDGTDDMEQAAVGSPLEVALASVAEVVEDHEERLAALEQAAEDDAAAQMTLEQYVDHLHRDFDMTEVRPDWRDVPAVFAELAALRKAYVSVYKSRSGAFEQIYYLDALERVRARITEHYKRHTKVASRR